MQFFHPANDAVPTPSARLSETAAKHDAKSGVIVPDATATVPTTAPTGTGTGTASGTGRSGDSGEGDGGKIGDVTTDAIPSNNTSVSTVNDDPEVIKVSLFVCDIVLTRVKCVFVCVWL